MFSEESQQSYFALFQLPMAFDIDSEALQRCFQILQKQVHPDRFAAASDQEKRVAMQYSARVNEAYQTLSDPVKRAQYLLQCAGHPLDLEGTVAIDSDFMMQQMHWREQLDDFGNNSTNLQQLQQELTEYNDKLYQAFSQFHSAENYQSAEGVLAKMQFLKKIMQELKQRTAQSANFGA